MTNRLTVSSTCFQHPQHHLVMWYSNDSIITNQIDHILLKARWPSSVLDCCTYYGAETGNKNGSDHIFVRAKMYLHLKVNKKMILDPRFDVAKLKCKGTKATFQLKLSNHFSRFKALQPDSASAEDVWQSFKGTVRKNSQQSPRVDQKAKIGYWAGPWSFQTAQI